MNEINNIAVLLTTYNRKEKTIECLNSLFNSLDKSGHSFQLSVFLTDDNSSDGTIPIVKRLFNAYNIVVIKGTGYLYWNGGMISSWRAAIKKGGFDGYLWLNDDTTVLPNYFEELLIADKYSLEHFGVHGIYVGSTMDNNRTHLTYGGFDFINPWTLKDKFIIPNGQIQKCQCAHGNITYVSQYIVSKMGIFCDKYIHSGGDHDYTYRAYKRGLPLLVMRKYVGLCDNDHREDGYYSFMKMNLRERLHYLKSPLGFNLHNTLIFQKRCFSYRYPFVMIMGYLKALFPRTYFKIYKKIR
jgi:GT2 family glycosyltransferase